MKFRYLPALAVLMLAPAAAMAASVTFLSHNVLFRTTAANQVADIAMDKANRVWFATTNRGLTALIGNQQASGFPLNTSLFSSSLSSIVFADLNITGTPQEFFIIGSRDTSTHGLQAGRLLDTGLANLTDKTAELSSNFGSAATFVSALAVNAPANAVYAATDAGLVTLNLPSLTVGSNLIMPTPGEPVRYVTAADKTLSGGDAFFVTRTGDLHLLRPANAGTRRFVNQPFFSIGGISMDRAGNLWVAERTNGASNTRVIIKYRAADLTAFATTGTEPTSFEAYTFNPSNGSSFFSDVRDINDIFVNPLTDEVWLATDFGAFFQAPNLGTMDSKLCGPGTNWASPSDDVDKIGGTCAGKGLGWRPVPQNPSEPRFAVNESFGAIFGDLAGNMWIGSGPTTPATSSEGGVRAIISKLITFSSTRYLGYDARAVVTVEDDSATPVDVEVSVGTNKATLPLAPVGNGKYTLNFGFLQGDVGLPAPPLYNFPTKSTATDVDVKATYFYVDATGKVQPLTADAKWANIVKFEDDAFIGGFCFIKGLE